MEIDEGSDYVKKYEKKLARELRIIENIKKGIHLSDQDKQEAIKIYKKRVKLFKIMDDPNEAIEQYEMLIKLGEPSSIRKLGILYENHKMFDKAIAQYKKAIAVNQYDEESLVRLGFLSDGQLKSEYFNRALKFNRFAFLVLGNKYSIDPELNISKGAIRFYEEAIKFHDQALCAYRGMAFIYMRYDYVRAKTSLENALKIDNTDIWSLKWLGLIYLEEKRFSIARIYFNRMLEIQKDNPEAINGLKNCQ